jgi:hypothetical protein
MDMWMHYGDVRESAKALHGRLMLCGEAEVHFSGTVSRETLSTMSWDAFRQLMLDTYGQADDEFSARNKLCLQLKQRDGQSVADVAREFKLELGKLVRCPMNVGDQLWNFQNVLRPRLLRDIAVRGSLFDYGSLDAYIRVAEDVEAQLRKLSALSERERDTRRPKGSDVTRSFGTGNKAAAGSATPKRKLSGGSKCWTCGGIGHLKADCPDKENSKGNKRARSGSSSKNK